MRAVEKVLLVNPPWDASIGYGKNLGKMTFLFPPIGLMYLASYIERENGAQVRIHDCQANARDVYDEIAAFEPQLVGLTTQTAQYVSVTKVAQAIKIRFPDVMIVVGGSHPSARPRDTASDPNIDITVIGEGEVTLSEIIKHKNGEMALSDIKGIAYRNGNDIITTPPRSLMPDLDSLPMPAEHLIDLTKYRCSPDNQIGNKTAVITTSRGCPFDCTFCAIKDKTQKKYRVRSLESIEKELDYYKVNGVDSLFIMDDIFTLNKNIVFTFCDLLLRKNYNFKWWAQTRADCVTAEMLEKMKNAGCAILSFGIESGCDRLLEVVRKKITTEQARKAVKMARAIGITTRGGFILGLPTETFRESLKTIWFGLSLPLHRAKFGLLVPYPGTEVWALAEKQGQVKDVGEDWERFSPMWAYSKLPPSYVPEGRNPKVLAFLQKFANFVFYLKPSVVWDIVTYYNSHHKWNDLWFAVRMFLRATFIKSR